MNKKIENYPIDKLIFDPKNPRLPSAIPGDHEGAVIDWMLKHENVIELMGSIGEKGFFPAEPLLVVPSITKKGKFEVVEGNRRLTAVKLLIDPTKAETKKNSVMEAFSGATHKEEMLKELPVICFDARADLLAYLGYRHITGVQAWDALAKAKYLKDLKDTLVPAPLNEHCRILAKIIGSKASYVKLLLVGVEVYHKIESNSFYDIEKLNETSIDFGTLYTALSRTNISHYIGIDLDQNSPTSELNDEHLKDLTTWMFQKNSEGFSRVGESRNLALLDKVVANSKALNAFKQDGKPLKDAVLLTNLPVEIFEKSIFEALSSVRVAREYMHLIDSFTLNHEESLSELAKLCRTLISVIKENRSGNIDEF